ncbi:hypothetical protein BDA99DRAFT_59140 [Phascolomyces articulosus]|uniref:TRAF-type domain-containing protein n=1 Tax=Phascolomyces articulosus TaxID=60185 RepID=A0AAD5K028_9FUNG|nr:hypothetical protein BDA99DRAFT_59140 [Phascolomyces articulosus]
MPLCKPFFRKDKENHEKTCRSYPCPFAIEGCSYIGTLTDVNAHCDLYCGKLHQRIKDLEAECKRLNKCITERNRGNCKETVQQTTAIIANTKGTTATTPTKDMTGDDEDMGGIDLLEQMLSNNNDYLSLGLLNNDDENKSSNDASEPSSQQQQQQGSNASQQQSEQRNKQQQQPLLNIFGGGNGGDLMDLSDCLPPLPFMPNIDTNKQSQQPPPLSASIAAPKRSSNGKIIRYSKNVRLAHSALRMARQQQNRYFSDMNPFESLLEDLDVAIKPDYQYQPLDQQQHQVHQEPQNASTPMSQSVATPASIISTSSQQDDISNLMAQHTLSSPQNNPFSFNNLDDVQKYLSDMTSQSPQLSNAAATTTTTDDNNTSHSPAYTTPTHAPAAPITTGTSAQSSPLRNSSSSKTNKPRIKGDTKDKKNKKAAAVVMDARSPQSIRSPQPSSPNSAASPPTDAPKKRPMFVLASSYLTNYGNNNNNNKQQPQQQQSSSSSSS